MTKSWFLFKRRIKFIWQKWTRGFSDEEMWNLDITIAKFILPRIKRHFEINKSIPYGVEEVEWEEIKRKMLFAIQYFAVPDRGIFGYEENEKRSKEVSEGLDLFAKYFHMLWI